MARDWRTVPGWVRDIRHAIRDALRSAADDEAVDDVVLAASEACGNVVRHAYDAGELGWVRVVLERVDGGVSLTVEDRGRGFDMMNRPEVPEDGESGRGFGVMRMLVDAVQCCATPDGGTKVTMYKRLTPARTFAYA